MKQGKSFYRSFEATVSATEQTGVIEGRAVVFNEYSVPLYDFSAMESFKEIIRADALEGCDLKDVLLLVNHNDQMVPLARTRAGASGLGVLELSIESDGLYFRANLDIDNSPQSKEIYTAIKNGVLRGMSFCFYLEDGDSDFYYNDENELIHDVKKIRQITEISVVSFPAYPQTNLSARQARSLDNDRAGVETFLKAQEEAERELIREKIKLYF